MWDECWFSLFSGHPVCGDKLEQIELHNVVYQDRYLEGDVERRKCRDTEKRSVLAGADSKAFFQRPC